MMQSGRSESPDVYVQCSDGLNRLSGVSNNLGSTMPKGLQDGCRKPFSPLTKPLLDLPRDLELRTD